MAWWSFWLLGVSLGLSGGSWAFPGAALGFHRGRFWDPFWSWILCVLRSEVCNDFACVFLYVLESFLGSSVCHFGERSSSDDPFGAKRPICRILCKLQCFLMVLRTDGSLLSLLSERLCTTGRRCFPMLVFMWFLAPSGVYFGALFGKVERCFFMCFLASFF